MSRGGLSERVDALTGGPARRQRHMLKKLEELDRLDRLTTDPEQVLWPGGRSSHHDPRAWSPRPSRRASRGSHWWERHPSLGLGIALLIAASWFAYPYVPGWIDGLMPARPALAAGADSPPSNPSATSRLLPAVTVAEPPAPDRYAFLAMQDDQSGPVTFDPCRPLPYVVRGTSGANAADREVIEEAAARVSAASGLAFVDSGDTDEAPSEDRELYQPDRYGKRWAPVLIAWSDPDEQPALAGDTAGLGGGRPIRDTHGHLTYVSGTVWLDTPSLRPLLDTREGREQVTSIVMHELGHVLGAGHVQDSRELMAEKNFGGSDFGEGDRYALSVLGKGACVPGL